MNKLIGLLSVLVFSVGVSFAQNTTTSCADGEVGVFVSFEFTEVMALNENEWNIQDADGNILATSSPNLAANFVHTSQEVCLAEGTTFTFNATDSGSDGWGVGSWYEVGICGGNTVLIDNNGSSIWGSGTSEDFTLPIVTDDCFCFSVDAEQTQASTETAADGSIQTSIYAGNPPFTFLWSNGATTQNLVGVAPGVYVLTVTDSQGCEISHLVEVQGPNIYMGPNDVEACTGYFYDSGGANGNFDYAEDYTMTVCSTDPDLFTSITFYDFDIGDSDFTIYDGNSTAAPILYAYTGGQEDPGIISATQANTSGCLTVEFSSPFSNWTGDIGPGWFAEINCQYPCQNYSIELVTDDPINDQGEINACHDLDISVETDYFENNLFYEQEDLTTTFEWDFGDEQVGSGQEINHLYEEGEYELNVVVTDVNGCIQEASLTVLNENPGIEITFIPPSITEMCPDTQLEVSASGEGGADTVTFFNPIEWIITEETTNIGQDFGDGIFLPDGSGVSYVAELDVEAYNPLDVLDADDFEEVCVEIEHSYLGDLEIELSAPNGSSVMLHDGFNNNAPATSQFLGVPIDQDSNLDPGECWTYCWSTEPMFDIMNNALSPGGESMPPGDYTPEGNFADFSGSQANGTWVLTVTDHLSSDNGYICGWWLSMNVVAEDEIETIVDTIIPTILTYNWFCEEEPGSVLFYDSTMVMIQPENPGIHTYEMTLTDNFGCVYTEEFEMDVYGSPIAAPDMVSECQDQFDLTVANVPPAGGAWELISWPDSATVSFDPDTNSFTPQVTVSQVGEYVFEFTDEECELSDQMTVDVEVVNPIIDDVAEVICSLENQISVVDPTNNGGLWSVVSNDTVLAVLDDPSALQTILTAPDFGTYQVAFTVDFCFGTDTAEVHYITVDPYILNPGTQVCDFEVDLEVDNPSPTGGMWELISQPNHTSVEFGNVVQDGVSMEVDNFGAYEMQFTIDGCETTHTRVVNFSQGIPQITAEELLRCERETEVAVETYGMEVGWMQLGGPGVANFSNPISNETTVTVNHYGDYKLGYLACDTLVEFDILFMCDLIVPNVLTPNGDNINDYLYVENLTKEFYSYSNLSVFNRWGHEIYRNGHYGLDDIWWDGQSTHQNDELAEGVYFYVLKVGNKVTEEEDIYRGSFHLFKD